jgi:adenylyltransferase/sulfurtransferase
MSKGTSPILGVTAGVFGCLQAAEAVKLLTGIGQPLLSKLLLGDLQHNTWDIVEIARSRDCQACGSIR